MTSPDGPKLTELDAEIESLKRLEALALRVRRSGTDKKWEELSELLQGGSGAEAGGELFDQDGNRRKLIIFTEHKDTLDYLVGKRFGPWGVGVSGYYLKQTTDDKLDGRTISSALGPWSDGRKGQVFAIGPTVSYTTKNGVHFTGQWNRETNVENRFEGDKVMLKLIMPL